MVSQLSETGASNNRMMRSAQLKSISTVNRYIVQSVADKRKTNAMLTSSQLVPYDGSTKSRPHEPENTPTFKTGIRKVNQSSENKVSMGFSGATFSNCTIYYQESAETTQAKKRGKKK